MSTGADSVAHGGTCSPLLQIAGHGAHRKWKNSKHETDQTVPTITKALTNTTNCTFRAKKVWTGTTKYCFRRVCPHFLLRSGSTIYSVVLRMQISQMT